MRTCTSSDEPSLCNQRIRYAYRLDIAAPIDLKQQYGNTGKKSRRDAGMERWSHEIPCGLVQQSQSVFRIIIAGRRAVILQPEH